VVGSDGIGIEPMGQNAAATAQQRGEMGRQGAVQTPFGVTGDALST